MARSTAPRLFSPARSALAGVAVLALTLSACGTGDTPTPSGSGTGAGTGTGDGGTTAAAGVDAAAAAMVPADIKAKGKLVIGTDASYAPNEFIDEDGSTIIGMDVDLFDAVAAKLGLTTEWQNADFGTIIAGVSSGKYDVGVSSFTINDKRKEEVNMVSYFDAGTLWAVAPGNPKKVDATNPCGLTIAVQADTVQEQEDLPPKVKACEDAGKPITVQPYDGQDEATAALVTGKADAMLADSPIVAYAIDQSDGKIEALGEIYDSAPYGYVIAKDDTAMADAVVAALKSLEKDGGYEAALKQWGQTDGLLSDFAVNP